MMRGNSFWGSLVFAAVAAAALPAALLALGPFFGDARVVALYLVGTATGYSAWLAPSRRQAVAGALFTALLGGGLLVLLPGFGRHALAELAIGCALLVAVCRSVLFYRSRPLRGLLLECALTLAGLLTARLLAGPGPLSMAAALWGYLLVQSLFCLAPGLRVRSSTTRSGDPFERARARLKTLLEETP